MGGNIGVNIDASESHVWKQTYRSTAMLKVVIGVEKCEFLGNCKWLRPLPRLPSLLLKF